MLFTDGKTFSDRILRGEDVAFSLKFVDEKSLLLINAILVKILSSQGNIFLLETLITIIREIVFNAFKANLKRLYFIKAGVDLNDKEKYDLLMQNFKDDYLYKLDEIEEEITAQDDYHIQINFKKTDNSLKVTVFNNVAIIEEEFNRIKTRLEQSKKYMNLADAYNDIYDSTEGAGLGLALMVFLLKNSGIGVDNLSIAPDSKGVTVSVNIPKQLKEESIISSVKKKVLDDVDTLPTFPENIIELQNLCSRKDSTIDAIASKISQDPSLSADVIKLSNSAGFVPGKRIMTIKDAVKIIGLKNLNLILTASAAKTILQNKYKKFEVIWEHCIRVAYYSTLIAKSKQLGAVSDSAFTAGLLHDIGKIVLMSADDKIIHTISEITRNKQLRSSSILEEISVGISHAEIGGLIAEKWNFPANLKLAIENHHSPLNVEDEYKELSFSVYFANMLCGVEKNKYNYYYIETDILEWMQINTIEELKNFHEKLKTNYASQMTIAG
ncbi:MAG TPA: HDOD domain-containing protein [Spirochaetota bacterium]|nr:HDOD domain-containing protein [Spirochaetota bacterium]HPF04622.1 HDOD domain-containing protein [Spirochaetota bacterium]HPJ42031.1 HDOD domain-containing protein [Spirochaetota bacterium]HPR36177.1 HDOD domain-containing protein [Spirochaetota bacterium]HRX46144.1 HDOD domain-containing protein [Spirochaetota bacterium]